MTNPRFKIDRSIEYGRNKLWLETKDGKGRLRGGLDLKSLDFKINHIRVLTPRVGLGKELLRQAREEAILMKAAKVTATIVSRECLASMTEVFGAENIKIGRIGEFGIQHSTVAWLDVALNNPAAEV